MRRHRQRQDRDVAPTATGDGRGKEDHGLQVAGHREAQHQAGHLHRRAVLRPLHRKAGAHPHRGEKRERDLRELVRKNKRPVALFVDEAHDLNGHTLTGLKRLMELVEDGNGRLSIVLAGHPKLRNDLRRPTMEEIGYRTDIFSLDGITGSQREYIHWLLDACTEGKLEPESILTEDAIDLLATKLRTPLQIQLHLSTATEAGYLTGEKPVSAELVHSVLSRQLDDWSRPSRATATASRT